MRKLLFAISLLVCAAATAQPSVSIGMGGVGAGGSDCGEVARQIVHDWMDVGHLMGSDGSVTRPSANQFQCVAPAEVQGAIGKHVGGSTLRCYTVQRTPVCCDPQLRSCATLAQ